MSDNGFLPRLGAEFGGPKDPKGCTQPLEVWNLLEQALQNQIK